MERPPLYPMPTYQVPLRGTRNTLKDGIQSFCPRAFAAEASAFAVNSSIYTQNFPSSSRLIPPQITRTLPHMTTTPPYTFRPLQSSDEDLLLNYLEKLSPQTRHRFGPHPFDKQAIRDFYKPENQNQGFVAIEHKAIIAYAIIKYGFLPHDAPRLQGYGLELNANTDCTFAPSVADEWQGRGIGSGLFDFILSGLKAQGKKRLLLWGGVQASNEKAISYYLKKGFRILGEFEYHGQNLDMVLDIF